MFIKLTNKQTGKADVINTDKIVSFFADPADATGTIIMLDAGVIREVTEAMDAISLKMGVVVP